MCYQKQAWSDTPANNFCKDGAYSQGVLFKTKKYTKKNRKKHLQSFGRLLAYFLQFFGSLFTVFLQSFGSLLAVFWQFFGSHFVVFWLFLAVFRQPVCTLLAIFLQAFSRLFAVCLQSFCSLLAIFQQAFSSLYAVCLYSVAVFLQFFCSNLAVFWPSLDPPNLHIHNILSFPCFLFEQCQYLVRYELSYSLRVIIRRLNFVWFPTAVYVHADTLIIDKNICVSN